MSNSVKTTLQERALSIFRAFMAIVLTIGLGIPVAGLQALSDNAWAAEEGSGGTTSTGTGTGSAQGVQVSVVNNPKIDIVVAGKNTKTLATTENVPVDPDDPSKGYKSGITKDVSEILEKDYDIDAGEVLSMNVDTVETVKQDVVVDAADASEILSTWSANSWAMGHVPSSGTVSSITPFDPNGNFDVVSTNGQSRVIARTTAGNLATFKNENGYLQPTEAEYGATFGTTGGSSVHGEAWYWFKLNADNTKGYAVVFDNHTACGPFSAADFALYLVSLNGTTYSVMPGYSATVTKYDDSPEYKITVKEKDGKANINIKCNNSVALINGGKSDINWNNVDVTINEKTTQAFAIYSYVGSYFADCYTSAEATVVKSFGDIVYEPSWTDGALHMLINIDQKADESMGGLSNTAKDVKNQRENIARLQDKDVHLIQWGSNTNKNQAEALINKTKGLFLYDLNIIDAVDQPTNLTEEGKYQVEGTSEERKYKLYSEKYREVDENAIVQDAKGNPKKTDDYYKGLLDKFVRYLVDNIGQDKRNNVVYVNEPFLVNVEPANLKDNARSSAYPAGRWRYMHDPTVYTNTKNASGAYIYDVECKEPDTDADGHVISQGKWSSYSPKMTATFEQPGRYLITFDDKEILEIYAQRRAISDFTFEVDASGNLSFTNLSSDDDQADKVLKKSSQGLDSVLYGTSGCPGIEKDKWEYQVNFTKGGLTYSGSFSDEDAEGSLNLDKFTDGGWSEGVPGSASFVETGQNGVNSYNVRLTVWDYQAQSDKDAVTCVKSIGDGNPVASFKINDTTLDTTESLDIVNMSYDPTTAKNPDNKISKYQWTLVNSNGRQLKAGAYDVTTTTPAFPVDNFNLANIAKDTLGANDVTYRLKLVVWSNQGGKEVESMPFYQTFTLSNPKRSNTINHYARIRLDDGTNKDIPLKTSHLTVTETKDYSVNDLLMEVAELPKGFAQPTLYTRTYKNSNGQTVTDKDISFNKNTKVTQSAADEVINFYYPAQSYKITYNVNGGTVDASQLAEKYLIGTEIQVPTPTRMGYNFVSWRDTTDQTDYSPESEDPSVTYINKDANILAAESLEDLSKQTFASTASKLNLKAIWEVKKPKIVCEVTDVKLPNEGGNVSIGDEIQMTIHVANEEPDTILQTVSLGFDVPNWLDIPQDGMSLVPVTNNVAQDPIAVSGDVFDTTDEPHNVKVYLGDINGGSAYDFTFSAIVGEGIDEDGLNIKPQLWYHIPSAYIVRNGVLTGDSVGDSTGTITGTINRTGRLMFQEGTEEPYIVGTIDANETVTMLNSGKVLGEIVGEGASTAITNKIDQNLGLVDRRALMVGSSGKAQYTVDAATGTVANASTNKATLNFKWVAYSLDQDGNGQSYLADNLSSKTLQNKTQTGVYGKYQNVDLASGIGYRAKNASGAYSGSEPVQSSVLVFGDGDGSQDANDIVDDKSSKIGGIDTTGMVYLGLDESRQELGRLNSSGKIIKHDEAGKVVNTDYYLNMRGELIDPEKNYVGKLDASKDGTKVVKATLYGVAADSDGNIVNSGVKLASLTWCVNLYATGRTASQGTLDLSGRGNSVKSASNVNSELYKIYWTGALLNSSSVVISEVSALNNESPEYTVSYQFEGAETPSVFTVSSDGSVWQNDAKTLLGGYVDASNNLHFNAKTGAVLGNARVSGNKIFMSVMNNSDIGITVGKNDKIYIDREPVIYNSDNEIIGYVQYDSDNITIKKISIKDENGKYVEYTFDPETGQFLDKNGHPLGYVDDKGNIEEPEKESGVGENYIYDKTKDPWVIIGWYDDEGKPHFYNIPGDINSGEKPPESGLTAEEEDKESGEIKGKDITDGGNPPKTIGTETEFGDDDDDSKIEIITPGPGTSDPSENPSKDDPIVDGSEPPKEIGKVEEVDNGKITKFEYDGKHYIVNTTYQIWVDGDDGTPVSANEFWAESKVKDGEFSGKADGYRTDGNKIVFYEKKYYVDPDDKIHDTDDGGKPTADENGLYKIDDPIYDGYNEDGSRKQVGTITDITEDGKMFTQFNYTDPSHPGLYNVNVDTRKFYLDGDESAKVRGWVEADGTIRFVSDGTVGEKNGNQVDIREQEDQEDDTDGKKPITDGGNPPKTIGNEEDFDDNDDDSKIEIITPGPGTSEPSENPSEHDPIMDGSEPPKPVGEVEEVDNGKITKFEYEGKHYIVNPAANTYVLDENNNVVHANEFWEEHKVSGEGNALTFSGKADGYRTDGNQIVFYTKNYYVDPEDKIHDTDDGGKVDPGEDGIFAINDPIYDGIDASGNPIKVGYVTAVTYDKKMFTKFKYEAEAHEGDYTVDTKTGKFYLDGGDPEKVAGWVDSNYVLHFIDDATIGEKNGSDVDIRGEEDEEEGKKGETVITDNGVPPKTIGTNTEFDDDDDDSKLDLIGGAGGQVTDEDKIVDNSVEPPVEKGEVKDRDESTNRITKFTYDGKVYYVKIDKDVPVELTSGETTINVTANEFWNNADKEGDAAGYITLKGDNHNGGYIFFYDQHYYVDPEGDVHETDDGGKPKPGADGKYYVGAPLYDGYNDDGKPKQVGTIKAITKDGDMFTQFDYTDESHAGLYNVNVDTGKFYLDGDESAKVRGWVEADGTIRFIKEDPSGKLDGSELDLNNGDDEDKPANIEDDDIFDESEPPKKVGEVTDRTDDEDKRIKAFVYDGVNYRVDLSTNKFYVDDAEHVTDNGDGTYTFKGLPSGYIDSNGDIHFYKTETAKASYVNIYDESGALIGTGDLDDDGVSIKKLHITAGDKANDYDVKNGKIIDPADNTTVLGEISSAGVVKWYKLDSGTVVSGKTENYILLTNDEGVEFGKATLDENGDYITNLEIYKGFEHEGNYKVKEDGSIIDKVDGQDKAIGKITKAGKITWYDLSGGEVVSGGSSTNQKTLYDSANNEIGVAYYGDDGQIYKFTYTSGDHKGTYYVNPASEKHEFWAADDVTVDEKDKPTNFKDGSKAQGYLDVNDGNRIIFYEFTTGSKTSEVAIYDKDKNIIGSATVNDKGEFETLTIYPDDHYTIADPETGEFYTTGDETKKIKGTISKNATITFRKGEDVVSGGDSSIETIYQGNVAIGTKKTYDDGSAMVVLKDVDSEGNITEKETTYYLGLDNLLYIWAGEDTYPQPNGVNPKGNAVGEFYPATGKFKIKGKSTVLGTDDEGNPTTDAKDIGHTNEDEDGDEILDDEGNKIGEIEDGEITVNTGDDTDAGDVDDHTTIITDGGTPPKQIGTNTDFGDEEGDSHINIPGENGDDDDYYVDPDKNIYGTEDGGKPTADEKGLYKTGDPIYNSKGKQVGTITNVTEDSKMFTQFDYTDQDSPYVGSYSVNTDTRKFYLDGDQSAKVRGWVGNDGELHFIKYTTDGGNITDNQNDPENNPITGPNGETGGKYEPSGEGDLPGTITFDDPKKTYIVNENGEITDEDDQSVPPKVIGHVNTEDPNKGDIEWDNPIGKMDDPEKGAITIKDTEGKEQGDVDKDKDLIKDDSVPPKTIGEKTDLDDDDPNAPSVITTPGNGEDDDDEGETLFVENPEGKIYGTNEGGDINHNDPPSIQGPNGEEKGEFKSDSDDPEKPFPGTIVFNDKTYYVDENGIIRDLPADDENSKIVGWIDKDGIVHWVDFKDIAGEHKTGENGEDIVVIRTKELGGYIVGNTNDDGFVKRELTDENAIGKATFDVNGIIQFTYNDGTGEKTYLINEAAAHDLDDKIKFYAQDKNGGKEAVTAGVLVEHKDQSGNIEYREIYFYDQKKGEITDEHPITDDEGNEIGSAKTDENGNIEYVEIGGKRYWVGEETPNKDAKYLYEKKDHEGDDPVGEIDNNGKIKLYTLVSGTDTGENPIYDEDGNQIGTKGKDGDYTYILIGENKYFVDTPDPNTGISKLYDWNDDKESKHDDTVVGEIDANGKVTLFDIVNGDVVRDTGLTKDDEPIGDKDDDGNIHLNGDEIGDETIPSNGGKFIVDPETGEIIAWYNPETGEIIYYNPYPNEVGRGTVGVDININGDDDKPAGTPDENGNLTVGGDDLNNKEGTYIVDPETGDIIAKVDPDGTIHYYDPYPKEVEPPTDKITTETGVENEKGEPIGKIDPETGDITIPSGDLGKDEEGKFLVDDEGNVIGKIDPETGKITYYDPYPNNPTEGWSEKTQVVTDEDGNIIGEKKDNGDGTTTVIIYGPPQTTYIIDEEGNIHDVIDGGNIKNPGDDPIVGPNGEDAGVYTPDDPNYPSTSNDPSGKIEFGKDTPDDPSDDKTYIVKENGDIVDTDVPGTIEPGSIIKNDQGDPIGTYTQTPEGDDGLTGKLVITDPKDKAGTYDVDKDGNIIDPEIQTDGGTIPDGVKGPKGEDATYEPADGTLPGTIKVGDKEYTVTEGGDILDPSDPTSVVGHVNTEDPDKGAVEWDNKVGKIAGEDDDENGIHKGDVIIGGEVIGHDSGEHKIVDENGDQIGTATDTDLDGDIDRIVIDENDKTDPPTPEKKYEVDDHNKLHEITDGGNITDNQNDPENNPITGPNGETGGKYEPSGEGDVPGTITFDDPKKTYIVDENGDITDKDDTSNPPKVIGHVNTEDPNKGDIEWVDPDPSGKIGPNNEVEVEGDKVGEVDDDGNITWFDNEDDGNIVWTGKLYDKNGEVIAVMKDSVLPLDGTDYHFDFDGNVYNEKNEKVGYLDITSEMYVKKNGETVDLGHLEWVVEMRDKDGNLIADLSQKVILHKADDSVIGVLDTDGTVKAEDRVIGVIATDPSPDGTYAITKDGQTVGTFTVPGEDSDQTTIVLKDDDKTYYVDDDKIYTDPEFATDPVGYINSKNEVIFTGQKIGDLYPDGITIVPAEGEGPFTVIGSANDTLSVNWTEGTITNQTDDLVGYLKWNVDFSSTDGSYKYEHGPAINEGMILVFECAADGVKYEVGQNGSVYKVEDGKITEEVGFINYKNDIVIGDTVVGKLDYNIDMVDLKGNTLGKITSNAKVIDIESGEPKGSYDPTTGDVTIKGEDGEDKKIGDLYPDGISTFGGTEIDKGHIDDGTIITNDNGDWIGTYTQTPEGDDGLTGKLVITDPEDKAGTYDVDKDGNIIDPEIQTDGGTIPDGVKGPKGEDATYEPADGTLPGTIKVGDKEYTVTKDGDILSDPSDPTSVVGHVNTEDPDKGAVEWDNKVGKIAGEDDDENGIHKGDVIIGGEVIGHDSGEHKIVDGDDVVGKYNPETGEITIFNPEEKYYVDPEDGKTIKDEKGNEVGQINENGDVIIKGEEKALGSSSDEYFLDWNANKFYKITRNEDGSEADRTQVGYVRWNGKFFGTDNTESTMTKDGSFTINDTQYRLSQKGELLKVGEENSGPQGHIVAAEDKCTVYLNGTSEPVGYLEWEARLLYMNGDLIKVLTQFTGVYNTEGEKVGNLDDGKLTDNEGNPQGDILDGDVVVVGDNPPKVIGTADDTFVLDWKDATLYKTDIDNEGYVYEPTSADNDGLKGSISFAGDPEDESDDKSFTVDEKGAIYDKDDNKVGVIDKDGNFNWYEDEAGHLKWSGTLELEGGGTTQISERGIITGNASVDKDGKPVLDEDGQPTYDQYYLDQNGDLLKVVDGKVTNDVVGFLGYDGKLYLYDEDGNKGAKLGELDWSAKLVDNFGNDLADVTDTIKIMKDGKEIGTIDENGVYISEIKAYTDLVSEDKNVVDEARANVIGSYTTKEDRVNTITVNGKKYYVGDYRYDEEPVHDGDGYKLYRTSDFNKDTKYFGVYYPADGFVFIAPIKAGVPYFGGVYRVGDLVIGDGDTKVKYVWDEGRIYSTKSNADDLLIGKFKWNGFLYNTETGYKSDIGPETGVFDDGAYTYPGDRTSPRSNTYFYIGKDLKTLYKVKDPSATDIKDKFEWGTEVNKDGEQVEFIAEAGYIDDNGVAYRYDIGLIEHTREDGSTYTTTGRISKKIGVVTWSVDGVSLDGEKIIHFEKVTTIFGPDGKPIIIDKDGNVRDSEGNIISKSTTDKPLVNSDGETVGYIVKKADARTIGTYSGTQITYMHDGITDTVGTYEVLNPAVDVRENVQMMAKVVLNGNAYEDVDKNKTYYVYRDLENPGIWLSDNVKCTGSPVGYIEGSTIYGYAVKHITEADDDRTFKGIYDEKAGVIYTVDDEGNKTTIGSIDNGSVHWTTPKEETSTTVLPSVMDGHVVDGIIRTGEGQLVGEIGTNGRVLVYGDDTIIGRLSGDSTQTFGEVVPPAHSEDMTPIGIYQTEEDGDKRIAITVNGEEKTYYATKSNKLYDSKDRSGSPIGEITGESQEIKIYGHKVEGYLDQETGYIYETINDGVPTGSIIGNRSDEGKISLFTISGKISDEYVVTDADHNPIGSYKAIDNDGAVDAKMLTIDATAGSDEKTFYIVASDDGEDYKVYADPQFTVEVAGSTYDPHTGQFAIGYAEQGTVSSEENYTPAPDDETPGMLHVGDKTYYVELNDEGNYVVYENYDDGFLTNPIDAMFAYDANSGIGSFGIGHAVEGIMTNMRYVKNDDGTNCGTYEDNGVTKTLVMGEDTYTVDSNGDIKATDGSTAGKIIDGVNVVIGEIRDLGYDDQTKKLVDAEGNTIGLLSPTGADEYDILRANNKDQYLDENGNRTYKEDAEKLATFEKDENGQWVIKDEGGNVLLVVDRNGDTLDAEVLVGQKGSASGESSGPGGNNDDPNNPSQVQINKSEPAILEYKVQGAGGTIKGLTTQKVDINTKAGEVEALASSGYKFVRWSDGNVNAKRQDIPTQDMAGKTKTIFAMFELVPVEQPKVLPTMKVYAANASTGKVTLAQKKSFSLKGATIVANPGLNVPITGKVTYVSSNPKIVKVNAAGKITADKKKTGSAKITIASVDNPANKKVITVKVVKKAKYKKIKAIKKTNIKASYKVNKTVKVKVSKWNPSAPSNKNFTVTVSPKSKATLDPFTNTVKFIGKGKVTITVKGTSETKKIKVKVKVK